ncbi:unnamed protein product [Miscanthus lutarioriparius]|uniref:TFIIS N-terminal domain-containing protein n=1 Tax=Miscanthus lutarioriparius TaxID=422564 RepID=A0A811RZT6_9POAL|nr:unnamed protein product [Miscanthus lutarioriparius]
MVEALETLRLAPVLHNALASTDLARAIGALGNHGSTWIWTLAGNVVHGWKATNVATATSVKDELVMLSVDRIPRQGISTAIKKVVAQSEKMEAKKPIVTQSEKMEAKKPIVTQS